MFNFIDKSLKSLAEIVGANYVQWETSKKNGLFQRLNPRLKLVFFIFNILLISIKKDVSSEAFLFLIMFIFITVSRLDLFRIYKKILFAGFFFGFLVALPSSLNIITDGEIVLHLARLDGARQFWIYRIPAEIGITREGLSGVAMLCLRVMNSVSVSLLIIFTTPFYDLMKSLKTFRVPDSFIMIVLLSYKYIFILSKTIEDFYLALKSRLIGNVKGSEIRDIIAGRTFLVFKKSTAAYEEVYRAMVARGFSGSVSFYLTDRITAADLALFAAVMAPGIIISAL
ncbi:MAG: cobalt ECF transporter T component CbiQ [Spirochaetes bacterium]|nr:cobalt ECF transporter T component CbiQ [Spirochaetota bacterium]